MNTHSTVTPSLSVSVVVHRSPLHWLEQTLSSLQVTASAALEQRCVSCVSVWVLDNSMDAAYSNEVRALVDGLDESQQRFSWHYVLLTYNAGFGAAHNRALLDTTTDYHLILNPDVDLARDALPRAVDVLHANPALVALGPRVRGANGQQEFVCKDYPSVLVLFLRGFAPAWLRTRFERQLHSYELRHHIARDRLTPVPLLSGCFLLLRAPMARRIGGFDSGYFLYFEDFDLSLRLRETGSLVYAPQVNIVHYGGRTAAKGWRHQQWFLRSALRFFKRYGWRWW